MTIESLKKKLAEVRIQRNEYEKELRELRNNNFKGKFLTPPHLHAYGHNFTRYLFNNEYAEEMICRCGVYV